MPRLSRRFNVLLVEDNEDDVLLTKHAFKKARIDVDFQVAGDGIEALSLLRQIVSQGRDLPDMILLDLNMPKMDGRQLLSVLKGDEKFKIIPTVILTTSSAEDDVCAAYSNHANSYMVKPIELQEFSDRIKGFVDFWFGEVARLPLKTNQALEFAN
jgi:CheY-like chemotaxis protein